MHTFIKFATNDTKCNLALVDLDEESDVLVTDILGDDSNARRRSSSSLRVAVCDSPSRHNFLVNTAAEALVLLAVSYKKLIPQVDLSLGLLRTFLSRFILAAIGVPILGATFPWVAGGYAT